MTSQLGIRLTELLDVLQFFRILWLMVLSKYLSNDVRLSWVGHTQLWWSQLLILRIRLHDDRTGPLIEVRRWIGDDSQTESQHKAAFREGVYVKVTGQIHVLNKQLSILGFRIKPIEDFNEVTNHLLQVIVAHLALTKGMPLPEEFAK